MTTIVPLDFFNRPALDVTHDLLGKYLVRQLNDQIIALKINEVEAYDGPLDLACHARVGMTKRNKILFEAGGHFYVYFIYGTYWLLNIVTGPPGYPAGVLLRGAGSIIGPGRLTQYLNIDKTLNGKLAIPETGLWVEDRNEPINPQYIIQTPRIGVNYAGPIWSQVPYRFMLKEPLQ